jgi:hypothetical protein
MSRLTFKEETYFGAVDYDPEQDTYTIGSVHRWYPKEGGGTAMEMWDADSGQWVDNPQLVAATGIGGDSCYEPITKERSERFIQGAIGAERL